MFEDVYIYKALGSCAGHCCSVMIILTGLDGQHHLLNHRALVSLSPSVQLADTAVHLGWSRLSLFMDVIVIVGHGGVMVGTSDSELRESGFKSFCCHFAALAISFTPHCFSSLRGINEYLIIN